MDSYTAKFIAKYDALVVREVLAAYDRFKTSPLGIGHIDYCIDVENILSSFKPLNLDRPRAKKIMSRALSARFIANKLFPLHSYFPEKRLSNKTQDLSGIAALATVSAVPLTLDTVEKSKEWLEAHHETHSHFDSLLLRWAEYVCQEDVPGWVYFIENTETKRIKIGYAKDVESRLKRQQIGNDCELRVVHKLYTKSMKAEERYFHSRFATQRFRGEWFFNEGELASFLLSIGNADTCDAALLAA